MKKILHIVGTMDRGGAETMVMNLYRVLDKANYQFDFLYFTDKDCDYDEEIRELGGNIYRITDKNIARRMLSFGRLLKVQYFDVVHSHILFASAFYMPVTFFRGVKTRIAHSHSTSDKRGNIFGRRVYHSISRLVINTFANKFIACGYKAAEYLFYNNKDVLFLPNAIDVEAYSNIGIQNRDYWTEQFNIPSRCHKIVQIGTLKSVKNQEFTLGLAKYMLQEGYDFHIMIVGRGKLLEELQSYVGQNGLSENVTFLGLRTDIDCLLAGADTMLMPSLYEGFPVVLVESQATGIPALISDTISREVDLGVGLVEFESLSSGFDIWFEMLKGTLSMKSDAKTYLESLKNAGFNIYNSVKKLEEFYKD